MSAGCESSPTSGGGSSSGSSGAPRRTRAPRASDAQGQPTDDMDVNSNGSSGNESHGDSHSSSHSSGNGKDSALLETTESNKSSNSQSPSPASSSIAYSLLSASSEQDNPSTSGCSSEQSARVKTQKELMKALKEMKIRLPSEKRSKGKSGTLATLQYALSCVKQVQASQDYYQQWSIDDSQACSLDMSTYTIEELENVTSEYTLKNPVTATDYTQEKSVFCRISGGHAGAREMRYSPFRLTPYLTKVRDSDSDQGQPCCLLIAERIHSGYEVLQYAGQPFDHSPIRFCARNGEYVTIDTSWSSFVNPWSRKVSFIMGRHKVRTSPLNEDVFTAPKALKSKALDVDIQELSEQIHRLLLQPVHSSGALGLCSNSASHEQFLSIASSSDSNGFSPEEAQALRPMTFQEICKDVHMVKNQGQQVFIESRVKPVPVKPFRPGKKPLDPLIGHAGQSREVLREAEKRTVKAATSEDSVRKEPSNYSYQQINCLDVIIRYLESCNIPIRVKRKCGSSSYTASSNSDDDKQKGRERAAVRSKDAPEERLPARDSQPERKEPGTAAAAAVVGGPLTPLALPSKAESVVSVTSQCSFSSTIVHVGDKKPPESDIVMMEETAPSATPPVPPPGLTPDREQQYRRVGLTKEVLSVHTQKEEHAFLTRFKDLSQLRVFNSPSRPSWQELHRPRGQEERGSRGLRHGPRGPRRGRKSRAKRIRQNKSSDSSSSPQTSAGSPPQISCPPAAPSWAPSGPSPPTLPNMSYPAVMPTYPIPVFSPRPTVPPGAEPSQTLLPALQFPAPLATPMVALVLPNYVFPQINSPLPQTYFPGGPLFPFGPPQPGSMLAPGPEARSSTPHSMSQPERAESPLFESRCSSPLQLNLLQMEELPKPGDRQEASASSHAGPAGTSADWAGVASGQGVVNELGPPKDTCMVEAHDSSNNDALSGSSDLLDLLLQEDSHSGTESAASGSMGSGSNGESTSASGTTSSKSSNTSKYFGSIDSSENDLRAKKRSEVEDNEHFIKYFMQEEDPIWLLMANTDDKVMMSYQLPARDTETVLREDREKLKQLQKQQPRFTEEQKKELADVHSWVQKGVLPKAINVTACVECESNAASQAAPLYDVEIQDMDLNGMLEPMEEGTGAQVPLPSSPLEMAMEEEEAGESRDQPHLLETEAQGTS
ncbi:period circadian protein homolog 1 [Protobothrops mucrosquamatus]|uniref:period circadian protein homolog 1 n=1 Tax=Protobothrops mucrosquamatus TaxID=103944 RepID=UPI000775620E|nr:period circadian protein homolog 1 [Protobothrops mucrosquamatus]